MTSAPLTGPELRAIRERLGMSKAAFGRVLGYAGDSARVNVDRYERKGPPPWIARLALMLDRHGIPEEWRTSRETPKASADPVEGRRA